MCKRYIISGGSGLIGKALIKKLRRMDEDMEIFVLTRDVQKAQQRLPDKVQARQWDAATPEGWRDIIDGGTIIVNLAGENIAEGAWTEKKKERIRDSRIQATQAIANAVVNAEEKPAAIIQTSAVGYYGSRGNEELKESSPPGQSFLSQVCQTWENTIEPAREQGVRVAIVRIGVVLARESGFLPQVRKPFDRYVGGVPGSKKNWLPWIHIEDVVRAIIFLMEHDELEGAFNLSNPNPVQNQQFYHELADVIHRPCLLPVPAFSLRAMFGEMANELILVSQRIIPERLLEAGFQFEYPRSKEALQDLL